MSSVSSEVVRSVEQVLSSVALAAHRDPPDRRRMKIKRTLAQQLKSHRGRQKTEVLRALLERFPVMAGTDGGREESAALAGPIKEYERKLQEVSASRASLELELRKQQQENQHQSQRVQELESKVTEYEAALDDQRHRLKALEDQAQAEAAKVGSTEVAFRDSESQVEQLQASLENVTKAKEALSDKTRTQEVKNQELAEQVNQLKEQLSRTQREAASAPAAAPAEKAKPEPAADGRLPAEFVDVLTAHVKCLAGTGLDNSADTGRRLAECIEAIIALFGRVEQVMIAHLKFLGKHSERLGAMVDVASRQKLMSIEAVFPGAMAAPSGRITKLKNYCDLLWRWWTSTMVGIQATMEDVPAQLEKKLDPKEWHVPPRKFMRSEEETSWEHFEKVIRRELPLRLKDDQRRILAEKTYDAYANTRFPK